MDLGPGINLQIWSASVFFNESEPLIFIKKWPLTVRWTYEKHTISLFIEPVKARVHVQVIFDVWSINKSPISVYLSLDFDHHYSLGPWGPLISFLFFQLLSTFLLEPWTFFFSFFDIWDKKRIAWSFELSIYNKRVNLDIWVKHEPMNTHTYIYKELWRKVWKK